MNNLNKICQILLLVCFCGGKSQLQKKKRFGMPMIYILRHNPFLIYFIIKNANTKYIGNMVNTSLITDETAEQHGISSMT